MNWKKLEDVPEEHSFRLKDGKQVKSLYELALELAGMDDDTFQHHVNDSKNDFRNWILDIVKDEHLADKLSKVKDRKRMAKLFDKRVLQLEQEKNHREKIAKEGFKWGVREFGIGLVTGLFIGFVLLKAMGSI
jgi:hypothetical protein